MNIEIHHAEPFGQTETFAHVATFAAPDNIDATTALEVAYRWSQNIEGSWSRKFNPDKHPSMTVLAPLPVHDGKTYGHRSTSVGDRMKIGDQWYAVAGMGFKPL